MSLRTYWFIQGKGHKGKLHRVLGSVDDVGVSVAKRSECGRWFSDPILYRLRTDKGQADHLKRKLCEDCFGGGGSVQGIFNAALHREQAGIT